MTTWAPPKDPEAEGPTEAPALPEVKVSSDEKAVLPTDMVVALTSVTTTTLKAETPGEYSGTAVVVRVQVANTSEQSQNVDSAVVTLVADDEVGVATWADPYDPLQGDIAAGSAVEGTYVFMLDPADALGTGFTLR